MDFVRELTSRCPGAIAVHAAVQPAGDGWEGHVDLRFPEHQLIFNAAAATPEGAANEALKHLGNELLRLRVRDASLSVFDARQAA